MGAHPRGRLGRLKPCLHVPALAGLGRCDQPFLESLHCIVDMNSRRVPAAAGAQAAGVRRGRRGRLYMGPRAPPGEGEAGGGGADELVPPALDVVPTRSRPKTSA